MFYVLYGNKMPTKAQTLALLTYKKHSPELGDKAKLELLSYISNNEFIINAENSIHAFMLDIYLNDLLCPSHFTVAALLSTHFNLIVNEPLTNSAAAANVKAFIFDISPIEDDLNHWNESLIRHVLSTLDNIKKINFDVHLRICDAFSNSGEVVWFNPFGDNKEMSVKWGYNEYTIRDYETTVRMCSMAKRTFSDYITAYKTRQ
jgi:hypothetical protein